LQSPPGGFHRGYKAEVSWDRYVCHCHIVIFYWLTLHHSQHMFIFVTLPISSLGFSVPRGVSRWVHQICVSNIFNFLPCQTDLIWGSSCFCPRFHVCATCVTVGPHKNLGSYTGKRMAWASLTYMQFIHTATLFFSEVSRALVFGILSLVCGTIHLGLCSWYVP
jgi:hypothetical protein